MSLPPRRGAYLHLALWLMGLTSVCGAAATKPVTPPHRLAAVDTIIQRAIHDGQMPGAVLLVGHNNQVVYRKAFGSRALEPHREPMTLDTIFDLASLTKVVATTTAVMQLVEHGQLRVNDPVAKYIPEFAQNGKDDITIRQLLTHFSGLREDLDLTQPWHGEQSALRMACAETPVYPPGSRFLYSDINFEVLGAVVERVTGISLDQYTERNIFMPLGMMQTRFLPPAAWSRSIAPTEYDEQNKMLRGVVHDPTARRMGGVAGHAGLFSTADDLSKFAQALLNGSPVLSPLMIEKMTTPQQPPTEQVLRGFGWDIDSPFSSNRGDLLPVGSYGHTGFTGTSLWIDPTTRTYIILLTNAVHPRGKGSAVALRSKVATAVAAALQLTVSENETLRWKSLTGYNEAQTAARRLAVRNGSVQTGIDVLESHNFDLIRGTSVPKRIGVLTNQTGVDSQGRRTIDVLAHAPGVSLDAIFSPEHGLEGKQDEPEIRDSTDAATGLPVYSLYRQGQRGRPLPELLKGLDALVVDLQSAGVRFYSYEVMLGYLLETAAAAGIELVVLDRPDPITGAMVQGPMSAGEARALVNYVSLPVRPGMTMGELALLYNAERHVGARLQVVAMDGWMRGDWFDSTGLMWVNPSPNLRSLTQAALYPGVALIEGTNVSVGRGTDTPFELAGAPWVNGRELADYLNGRSISGVRFIPVNFTPAENRFSGQKCGGVNIVLIDRSGFDAPQLGIELASALRKLYPEQFHPEKMIDLLLNQAVYDAIIRGDDARRIAEDWRESLEAFQAVRQKYLLYK